MFKSNKQLLNLITMSAKVSASTVKLLNSKKTEYIKELMRVRNVKKDSKEALEILKIANNMDILISMVDPKDV